MCKIADKCADKIPTRRTVVFHSKPKKGEMKSFLLT